MLIKIHKKTLVWKSVVFELLKFENLSKFYWDNEENLLSFFHQELKFIIKVTQKAIFIFFPNKYTHFLKVSARNFQYRLILHDHSSTIWSIFAELFLLAFAILALCNLHMGSHVVFHILSSYMVMANRLELMCNWWLVVPSRFLHLKCIHIDEDFLKCLQWKTYEAIINITSKHVVCVVLLRRLSLETSLNQTLEAFSGKHHILNLQMNLVSHSKCIVEGIAQHCKSSRSLIYVYQRNKDVHNYMRSLS